MGISGNERSAGELRCGVCVLGAGIAGLNAVFAATAHLSPGDEVVLVDRASGPGGMWHNVYDYVRLHQAHPTFTVGDIPWRGQPDRLHLASKQEVLAHLARCLGELQTRCMLETQFETEYEGHEEGQGEYPVLVHCRDNRSGRPLTIRARKLIKAFGTGFAPMHRLQLSSTQVHSATPEDLCERFLESHSAPAPIYVVGGGKTGMDTAQTLIRARKRTRMLLGTGTLFLRRAISNPSGWTRHVTGHTPLDVYRDLAFRFDGFNEDEVMDRFRDRYAVALDGSCRHFMFGVLSDAENAEIRAGVDQVIHEHLVDVVDGPNGPQMLLRSGKREAIPAGSTFVNTTGYIRPRAYRYEPYLSERGHVLAIQPSSFVHFLTTEAAYSLTHLFLSGDLRDQPLYEVDAWALLQEDRRLFAPTAMALVMHNVSLMMRRLPSRAARQNGLDPMRMHPPHRRALSIAKLVWTLQRNPDHLRRALTRVQQRTGIRLGRLGYGDSTAQCAPALAAAGR